MTSPNTVYSLVLQEDGNLVLYRYDAARDRRTDVWSTKTYGKPVTSARLQDDGNFVLYTAADAVWEYFTSGTTGTVTLFVEDRGDLVMYKDDSLLWTTGCKAKGTRRGAQSITCAAEVA